jgi:hypothetical protein
LITLTLAVGIAVGWGVWLGGPAPRLTLRGDGAALWPARFAPSGRWLALVKRTTQGDFLEGQVWDLDSARVLLRFPKARLYAQAFSNDERLFAQAYNDNDDADTTRVALWNLETGEERADVHWTDLPGAMRWNMSGSVLAFTAENRLLLGATNFGLWDVETKQQIGPLQPLVPIGPMPCNWESSLLGYAGDRRVRLYSVARRAVVGEFALPADIRNFRWSEDGQALGADFYLGEGQGALVGVHVFDARTGTRSRVAAASEHLVQGVSSDGQWLAVSGESDLGKWWRRWLRRERTTDPVIRVFHAPSAELRLELPGWTAIFAPGAPLLAVRTSAGDVAIWDIPPAPPWVRSVVWGLTAAVVVVALRTVAGYWKRLRSNRGASGPPCS